jgi:hypothetical protein
LKELVQVLIDRDNKRQKEVEELKGLVEEQVGDDEAKSAAGKDIVE